jgi:hypothetical protein
MAEERKKHWGQVEKKIHWEIWARDTVPLINKEERMAASRGRSWWKVHGKQGRRGKRKRRKGRPKKGREVGENYKEMGERKGRGRGGRKGRKGWPQGGREVGEKYKERKEGEGREKGGKDGQREGEKLVKLQGKEGGKGRRGRKVWPEVRKVGEK